MTQPKRSPITNRLAETFPHNSINPVWSSTYPGAFLQRGGYLCPRLLELRDEDGRETHGEASTQARQVGDQPGQELGRKLGIIPLFLQSLLTILTGEPADPPPPPSIPSVCCSSEGNKVFLPSRQSCRV